MNMDTYLDNLSKSDSRFYYGLKNPGSGTLKIINSCKEASLPESEFIEIDGGVRVTVFKDVLTEEQLKKLGLNHRQLKSIIYVKEFENISNQKYQEINQVSKATATRDLAELVDKYHLFIKEGKIGAGTIYFLKRF